MTKPWPTKPLGELLTFLTSGSRGWAEYYREAGDLFLRIQNVGRNRILLDDVAFVAAPDSAEARRTLVRPGDVLLSITADLGRTAVVPEGIGRAYINQHLAILRVHNIHPPFLSAFFASPEGQTEVMGRNRHAVKAGLNFEDIRSFRIPQPPLAAQRHIAEVLDRAEALRAKRRAALAQLDSLTQSLFLDLFGDPLLNPKGWKLATLQQVASSIADGPFGSNMKLSDYVEEGVPVLQGKNITGNEFRWFDIRYISIPKANTLQRSMVRVGDHLLIKIGSIGYSALIGDLRGFECAVIPANLAKITPRHDLIADAYLHAFLTNERTARGFVAIASKTAQPALSLRKIKNFAIPLPPLPLQREFARRVSAVEKLKTAHRASLAELDALFASLQHRAFRGEL